MKYETFLKQIRALSVGQTKNFHEDVEAHWDRFVRNNAAEADKFTGQPARNGFNVRRESN